MTGRPTFDQLLADWIEDGPTDAPDRVLETVIAAIPSIPQRRSAMRFSRGFSAMPLPSRLAAVAVIGVVVVGAALFLTRPSPPAVGGPSPAPGVIANPSAPGSPSAGPSSSVVGPRPASWTATGSMVIARAGHNAVLLPDGRVLVVGGLSKLCYCDQGPLASAELYDPTTGSWAATGSMVTHRGGHTATLLPDGKVLVAGCANGNDAPSAELYDPGTGSWTATGSMVTPRCLDFTATLLPDGRVLVAGGMGTGTVLASAELYDPGTGSWTATGSMATPRYDHTATLLPNGKVLVAGGVDHGGAGCCALTSAELYDPASGSWTATGSMGAPHSHHTATLLPDGTVLVVDVSAELYDPATGSWTATKNPTTTFAVRATLLADGRVLGVGLVTVGTAQGSSVEVYDPASGSWTAAGGKGTPPYRNGFTATLLADGRVLVAGGFSDPQCGDCSTLASALLYDPGSP